MSKKTLRRGTKQFKEALKAAHHSEVSMFSVNNGFDEKKFWLAETDWRPEITLDQFTFAKLGLVTNGDGTQTYELDVHDNLWYKWPVKRSN